MKPICARCDLFMRSKHNGEYFEERMPGRAGAKREELEHDDYGVTKVAPGPLPGWEPYKLWVGDLWECRGCGAQVIVGVPPSPIAEHFHKDYHDRVNQTGVKRRIDDC